MTMLKALLPGLATIFCTAQLAGQIAAGDPDERAAARPFLEQYWERGPENRRAAAGAWQALQTAGQSSALVDLAYALNQIQHGQYRDARLATQKLQGKFPDDWDAWHLKIWAEMSVGNGNEALLLMQRMKSKMDASGKLDEATRVRIFQRLGRLFAFAEGPASDRIRPATLAETFARITEGLDDADLAAFEDQRAQTVRQYTGMLDEKSQNVAEQVQRSAENQATTLQQLTAENQIIGERQQRLQMETTAVQEQADAELGQMRARAAPLRSELASLDSRIISEQNQAAWIASDIANLQFAAANEPDPWRQHLLYQQIASAQITLANQNGVIFNLRNQFDSIAAEVNAIDAQIVATESRFGARLKGLDHESRQLGVRLNRNSRTISRLGDPQPESGYVKKVDAEITHLPTYDPFPIEEFRQQWLTAWK